jgi:hypothetical protein
MATNVNLNDFLINADVVLDGNGYSFKTKILDRKGEKLDPEKLGGFFNKVPDGIYWINGINELHYIVNGKKSEDLPTIQRNVLNLKGQVVDAFLPLKVTNALACLRGKGWSSSGKPNYLNETCPAKINDQLFIFEEKKYNNSVVTEKGYGADRFIVDTHQGEDYRSMDFTANTLYANIIKDGKIQLADMYAKNDGGEIRLFIDGFKVLEFRRLYISNLATSNNYDRYKDKKNPFLLRNNKKMYTKNENKFYFPKSMDLLNGSTFKYAIAEAQESRYYCTFSEQDENKFDISFLVGGSEKIRADLVTHFDQIEMYENELWDNDVDYSTIATSNNPYYNKKYSWRTVAFSTESEIFFSSVVAKIETPKPKLFEDTFKRYFVVSSDHTSDKFIEYPLKDFCYYYEDDIFALTTKAKRNDVALFGENGSSKGLKYKDIFENSSNPYSSHKADIQDGKMTIPSRILPPFEVRKVWKSSQKKMNDISMRRSSTPSLHFSYKKDSNFGSIVPGLIISSFILASGNYLCGRYEGGARGQCIWSESSHGDYLDDILASNSFLLKQDYVPSLMLALLRAQSENINVSDYTNASTSGTYKDDKGGTFNKADIFQVKKTPLISALNASAASNPFLFAIANGARGHWNFDLTPIKIQQDDALFYSFDPYTCVGLQSKEIYLYENFLKTICPRYLLVDFLKTQYFAKPATGPFTIGLFKNGVKVSRKDFFSQEPSSIANNIPMLSIDEYGLSEGNINFIASYRAFFVYDNEGNANIAHNLVAWNGYFSEGLRVHTKLEKRSIKTNFSNIIKESASIEEIKTKLTELQTSNKIEHLAISSDLDSFTPMGRVPSSNAKQYIDIELDSWEMSKTSLCTFKNGIPQDPIEKNKTTDASIVNKDKPSHVVAAKKDGTLPNGVSLKGHIANGRLIDLKNRQNIALFKGKVFKINVIDYSDPDQNGQVSTLKGKFIKYTLENGSLVASLADGEFCGCVAASGEMEMGGKFQMGVRLIAYSSPEGEFKQDMDSGIVYTIAYGKAVPLNGLLINNFGGPFWKDGYQKKPYAISWSSFEKLTDAEGETPATYYIDSSSAISQFIGYDYTSQDIFMVTSKEGEIQSLDVGNYFQTVSSGDAQNPTSGQVTHSVYMLNGKKMISISEPSLIGGGSSYPTVEDPIPRRISGNKWLVSGLSSLSYFSLEGSFGLNGVVVNLDDNGNGFVKYLSDVEVRGLDKNGKIYYIKAQFMDRYGVFMGLSSNNDDLGIYFIKGHPTPFKNDYNVRNINVNTLSNLNKSFLDKNGDGYLTLSFLEQIKYDFPKDNYEYINSLEILKTNKRSGTEIRVEVPAENISSQGFEDFNLTKKNKKLEVLADVLTLNRLVPKNKNIYIPDPKRYKYTTNYVTAIETILTLGKENIDESGNILYTKGSLESVKNNLDKIYLKVATEDDGRDGGVIRNELQKLSIVDLAKNEAEILWDSLPMERDGFPTIKKDYTRAEFANKFYKSLIHFRVKNGKVISLCILDKWDQHMSRYKPIKIQKRMEDTLYQRNESAIRILGTYQLQNEQQANELLKSVIYTDVFYIDVEEISEKYFDKIVPQGLWGTSAPAKNRTGSLNSKLTIDLFNTLGDDFESFLDVNLNENGNGFSDGVYWVGYVASPLNESGDGFWDNSFFEKGKPV